MSNRKKKILFITTLMLGWVSVVSASTISYTACPVNKQLYPRDLNINLGTVLVSGNVTGTGPSAILVRVWRDGAVYSETSQALVFSGNVAPFSVAPTIEAVLKNYTVDVVLVQGGETLDKQVTEVVAGDAYIINGQSNASAQIDNGYASAAPDERAFIRTFGVNWDAAAQTAADQIWRLARGDDSLWKSDGSIGRWGLRVGRLLSEETQVPVAILNGGRGAMAIDHFQRNDANHTDLDTNYGRMCARTIWAGVNNHVRAVLWYQGESDNGNKAVHEAGFLALYNDWKNNYPRLERIYVHQLHVGCGVIKDQLDLREWQRRLPDTYSDIKVISTNGNDEHDGCHYTDLGHQQGGNNLAALMAADLHSSANTANTTSPNPSYMYFSTPTFDQITIVMRNPTDTLTFHAGAIRDFILPGSAVTVASGTVASNTVVLSLSGNASSATGLGYTGHQGDDASYGPGEWVVNAAGVGLLSFFDAILPDAPATPAAPANAGASVLNSDWITLFWDASTGADGYVIKRDGTQIAGTTSLQYVDSGLTPATAYLYEVAASNTFGVSSFTAIPATTLAAATTAPSTPVGLNARLLESSSSVDLTWDAVAQATGYRVRRNGVEVGTTSAYEASFTDSGLVSGSTAYSYDVRAENGIGNSAYSAASGGIFRDDSAISNGSFEDEPVGTAVVIDSTTVVDSSTFSGWRFFSVGTPPKDFSATSVASASDWGVALRIDLTSNGAGGQDHGFDRAGSEIPVQYGNEYIFSLDAAWISGAITLDVIIQEFQGTTHLGNTVFSYSISDGNYQQFIEDWTPASSAVDNINIRIMPQAAAGASVSLLLDNVQLVGKDFPVNGLYTPSISSYAVTDHVVSTTVFHWFATDGGQLSGPWIPVGGRPSWTGGTDWWQAQIKQLMAANIDILYVHLIDQTEDIRVNLFRALNQLRHEGYDVPKVLPFLDPVVIYHGEPNVNLATTAGKDEFAGHYIRFFNQYYSVNQDAHADDYLAKTGGRVMLDTWHLHLNADNIPSLSRNDVESRLLAVFGAGSPFVNGIYQISPGLDFGGTLGFTDEKVIQYEEHLYFKKTSFNGVDTAQVKPGYWDQNVRNPGFILPRAGGAHYSTAWNSVNADPSIDHVYIESFNEYDEGSGIYPVDIAASPYLINGNTSSDTWSSGNDPDHYIKATAAGAAAFNDTPDRDAKILWHNFPSSMAAGSTQTVNVIVRNTGDASWTAAIDYKLGDNTPGGAVFGSPRYLIDDNADEIPIYGGIFRGRAKTFQITLIAPSSPGIYETRWRMLQEGVAWFGEELVHTVNVVFEKTPATVVLGNLVQAYDGFAKNVSATTVPSGLAVDLTYDGSTDAPTGPDSYVVVGTIDSATHEGEATGTFVIQMPAEYNAWFTSAELANPAISGPEVYFDGDQFSNWEEYIAGTDPTDGQVFPTFHAEPTALNGYVLSWASVSGRVYSVDWSPDLTQGFVLLESNILWPRSSYTDQTHQAETDGFYRMDVSLPSSTTNRTIIPGGAAFGVGTDLFQNATVTASSTMHPAGFVAEDMFSEGADILFRDAIFADDPTAVDFVEFNIASAISLRKIVVGLANDPVAGVDNDGRSLNNIRVYASHSSGTVLDNLVADVAVDPEYSTAYGHNHIAVSIDLAVYEARYFRLEFSRSNVGSGPRVFEIDGFSQ